MEGWKKTYLRLFCSERCEGSASFKSFQPHRANTSAFHRVLCVRLAFAGGLIGGTGQILEANSGFCFLTSALAVRIEFEGEVLKV